MRYMLLIYTDPAAYQRMTPEEAQQNHRAYFAFTQSIVDSGEHVAGDALQGVDAATTVRVREGRRTTTDGPFAETREHLGGYYLVECADLDRALELASQIPDAGRGCVEVRPLMEIPADVPS
jgi:hypothetical protein